MKDLKNLNKLDFPKFWMSNIIVIINKIKNVRAMIKEPIFNINYTTYKFKKIIIKQFNRRFSENRIFHRIMKKIAETVCS